MLNKSFRVRCLMCAWSAIAPGTAVAQTSPAWWAGRGVLTADAANDFAALNAGQLKHLAYVAWLELDSLPGGAGFAPAFTNAGNDYAAVNIGQLKETARPFYDRLGLAGHYPWSETSAPHDYALANIGQAKLLFSFNPQAADFDGDGMPDIWEAEHGFDPFVNQTDGVHGPDDDPDIDGLTNLQESKIGTDPRNGDSDGDGLKDGEEAGTGFEIIEWGQTSAMPVPSPLTHVVAVSAGAIHAIAVHGNGTVTCWGNNASGQCSPPADLPPVVAVATGMGRSLAVCRDGTVRCWGAWRGIVPDSATNVVAVAAEESNSVALRGDGSIICWSSSPYEQPLPPADLTNVVAVSAGIFHTAALTADGRVVCWGDNFVGECDVPAGLTNAVAIATGSAHTLALDGDGRVWCWGYNYYGLTNVPPSLAANVLKIGSGFDHALAYTASGDVVSWGYNASGQSGQAFGDVPVHYLGGGLFYSLALIGRSSYLTDPLNADSDGDGLSDRDEIEIFGTNPLIHDVICDNDGDHVLDAVEGLIGTDPHVGGVPMQGTVSLTVTYPASHAFLE